MSNLGDPGFVIPSAVSSDQALTFLASLLGSSAVAAGVTTVLARSNERKRQLREQMLKVSADFAGAAMETLASLRYYKPTKSKPDRETHRNEALFTDHRLRAERCTAVEVAMDQLRPLRGLVRLFFVTPSQSESTAVTQADDVVVALRKMLETSTKFWRNCDEQPNQRASFEAEAKREYDSSRDAAWTAINRFCEEAATRM